mgnify:CR=1 FL=1
MKQSQSQSEPLLADLRDLKREWVVNELAEIQEELRKVTNAHIADRVCIAEIQYINRRAEHINTVIETMTTEALRANCSTR